MIFQNIRESLKNNRVIMNYLNGKWNEKLYYLFFACFVLYWFINLGLANVDINFTVVKYALLLIGMISFGLMMISTKFTKKEIFIQIGMILFLVYYFIGAGSENTGLLMFYPAIIGLKNVKIKNVVRVMMWTLIISILLLIMLCIVGVLPVSFYEKTDAFGNSYPTIKFANQHGNTINIIVFNIITSYLYAYYDKITCKKLFILQLLAIIIYFILYSRTGLIITTVTIIGTGIIKYVKCGLPNGINKIKMILERYSYILFYVMVFIIGYFMKGTSFYNFLNKLISSRIFEVNHYLVDVGMKILPQYVKYDWICDNTQVKIMVSYGLIFTIIYLLLSYKTIKELQKRGKKLEIFLMIIYLLYSYSEVAFFKPISDFTMLFFVYAFQNIKCKDKENELDCGENKK